MSTHITTAKQLEVQRITEILSRAIGQQRLRPGTRLVESQLVEALNANRNHVQVALQRLAMQRIVTIEPNRGAMVAQPTAREAREVFIARRAIERAIVESITPDILRSHRQRISSHMRNERDATASEDRRAIVRELSEFHLILGEICGNKVLSEILSNLMVRSSLIVALYQRYEVPSCQCDEHEAIINALEAGDTAQAADIMLEHLDDLEGVLDLDDAASTEVNLRQVLSDL